MLPNLPAMVGDWDCREFLPVPTAAGWSLAVEADPSRWGISFDDSNSLGLVVTTNPVGDPNLSQGFIVPTLQYREFWYKDYGPLVGFDWFMFCRGAINPTHVTTTAIRLRRYTEPRLRRLQREIIETLPDLKPFLVDLLNRQEQRMGS